MWRNIRRGEDRGIDSDIANIVIQNMNVYLALYGNQKHQPQTERDALFRSTDPILNMLGWIFSKGKQENLGEEGGEGGGSTVRGLGATLQVLFNWSRLGPWA